MVANADTVYAIEFKLDGCPEEVLAQIERKDYALPFALDGRRVVKVGVNFDCSTRTIDKWLITQDK